ncbi:MAG TPA: hypothetical protein VF271_04220 [Rhodanobacteraceae bacterium]
MQVLTLKHFAGLLNQRFTVALEREGETAFVLVQAQPMNQHGLPVSAERAPFTLLFHHEAAVLFPQKTYAMSHAALGQFGIFLVPVARDRDGFLYQAVFN